MLGLSKGSSGTTTSPTYYRHHGDELEIRPVHPQEAIDLVARLPLAMSSAETSGCRPQLRYIPSLDEDGVHVAATAVQSRPSPGAEHCIVGVGWCQRHEGARVAELTIFVQDADRRQDIARKLVERLLEEARALGAVRLRASIDIEDEELMQLFATISTHPTLHREGERLIVELPVQAW